MLGGDGDINTPDAEKAVAAGSVYSTEGLSTEVEALGRRVINILAPMAQLEASGEQLAETFGYAGSRVIEMENQINKSATSVLGLSKNAMTYEAAMKRSGDIIKEVSVITNRNVILSSDVIKDLEMTAESTGVATKDLAQNFTDAGFQLTDVSKQMTIASDVAQKLGVNVGAVTKGVSDNLKNLNIYNFNNGIEGLAKMVAKSAVLGVNMTSVFNMAEKAFDPEQAIDLAASMQRLGVTTSDLLDPLKIMDLGQNNPDELMNQMVNVTKGLTKIDEVSGKVSILPGEQGRMRELAKAMDMPVTELAKMAIKSGELEFKMKKIAFPKMDAPMTEEDREMIANLAQFDKEKKGFAVTVESGEQKLVSELSPDDVEFLKKQAMPKDLEQIAFDQLTVSQKMLKSLEFIASAPRSGLARGVKGQEFRRNMDKEVATPVIKGTFKKDETTKKDFHDEMAEGMNGIAGTLLNTLPGKLTKLVTGAMTGGEFDFAKFKTDLGGIMGEIGTDLKVGLKNVVDPVTKLGKNIGKEVLKAQAPPELAGAVGAVTTATATTPEPSLNWHELLDSTMEQYKNSMDSNTITAPTEKTPQQIEEDKKQTEMKAMEEMLTAVVQQKETTGLNMSPVVDSGIAQTDRLIERIDLLIDTVKESKFEIDYDKLTTQKKDEENYTSIFEPITSKLNEFISIQQKIIGIKSPEPTIVEKKELKERTSETELTKVETAEVKPILTSEKRIASETLDGLQKITESKIPESAVRTNSEMPPLMMSRETTTNVGGEITLVVDVRGVQNDASRLIIDEVTKKINTGEFTNSLISQISNKESAYGQLSGDQPSTIPGFGGSKKT